MPSVKRVQLVPELPVYQVIQPNAPLFQSSNGMFIEDPNGANGLLIDCVFQKPYVKNFIKDIKNDVQGYIATHFHVDHSAKIHYYEAENIPLMAPPEEAPFMMAREHFLANTGLEAAGLDKIFRQYIMDAFDYKPCNNVEAIQPGKEWEIGEVIVKHHHLPGHSPGHPCFEIVSKDQEGVGIFFGTDLGLDKFGPWWGFPNCSLESYFDSLQEAEKLSKGKKVVASCHWDPVYDDFQGLFKRTRSKLERWIVKLLDTIKKYPHGFKAIQASKEDFVYKKDKLFEPLLPMFEFWETWMIENLCLYLVDHGKLECKEKNSIAPDFPNNVYVI
ncbi:MAG: MBL fold metallo-hydrolase [Candidatus Hodarchaeota archaeon]